MPSDSSPFGIRGFLIDAPEFGSLRSRRHGAIIVQNGLPYGKQGRGFDDLTLEDILALCIYHGGPPANLETYVRGRCVYRAPDPAAHA